jgi:hypothetical protein
MPSARLDRNRKEGKKETSLVSAIGGVKCLRVLPPNVSSLRDDITVEDYKKTLEDYLSKFIGLAEGG